MEEKLFYAEKCKKENKTSVITRIGLWGPWMDKLENLWPNSDKNLKIKP